MGNLRPIGSEKLQGMDKINRIMEIARYNEKQPISINENSTVEYNKVLSDGRNYQITKEKNGYVIKKSINESLSEYDYIEPMKNRRYYTSYSQAFKRLNLIVKEVNTNEGYDKNISLFTESDLEKEEKRYFLNVGKKETNEQAAPAPVQEPAPVAAPAAPVASAEPVPSETEPTDEFPEEMPDEMSDEMPDETEDEKSDEVVTIKTIQKLTGKLAQKLRAFTDTEEEMSSNDIKYVINSILSALKLDSLDDEDREQIMGKLEGSEEESTDEFEGMSDDTEESSDVEPEIPSEDEMESEMSEGFDDYDMEAYRDGEDFDEKEFKSVPLGKTSHRNLDDDSITIPKFFHNQFKNKLNDLTDFDIDFDGEFNEGSQPEKVARLKHDSIKDHEASKLEEMIEGLFTESTVDKVLSKYFTPNESTVGNKKELVSKVRKSSVNVVQEMVSLKLIKKHPNVKFLGKNKNNNLVFESKNQQVRITPTGEIL